MVNDKKYMEALVAAFSTNKSVLYSLGGKADPKRLLEMVRYAWKIAERNGFIIRSGDGNGAAIVSYLHRPVPFLFKFFLDLRLILFSIGLSRIRRVMKRNKRMKSIYPPGPKLYIWFIGVDPRVMQKGTGSKMLQEIMDKAHAEQLPIYLETSMKENLAFYEKHGFEVYHSESVTDSGYETFFIRKLKP